MERFSDATVKKLPAPAPKPGGGKTYKLYPVPEATGLFVRVTSADRRSFVMRYTVSGQRRSYTIGEFGRTAWGVVAARNEAKRIRQGIDSVDAVDPLQEKTHRRGIPTVAQAIDTYNTHFEQDPRRSPQSIRDYKRNGQQIAKYLGSQKIDSLKDEDSAIKSMHAAIGRTGKHRLANKLLTQLSAVLRSNGIVIKIPTKWRFTETKRKRYLKQSEIDALLNAMKTARASSGLDCIRLLLLTGARRGETMKATWDQFDLDYGTWTKPSQHTKQDKEHKVPLSSAAVDFLTSLKKRSSGRWVFPGNKPDRPITDVKKAWTSLKTRAGLDDYWRVHDLRHSYASQLVSRNVSLAIVGQLLGHTRPETTQRYAHVADEAMRNATEIMGGIVDGHES